MSQRRFPEEFKIESVRPIVERGHTVAKVSARLGVSPHSLYRWIKEQQTPPGQRRQQLSLTGELQRLKAELKRVTDERDSLKKSRRVLCQAVRVRYAFIGRHAKDHGVRKLCSVMDVHTNGHYAWKKQPNSDKMRDDQRLLGPLEQA